MPPKGQSKKAKQNPPKKAPVPGPAPAGKAEAPTPSNHIHTDSDLPLPIPPPQLPRGALIEATLPTIAIQSPSNASNALSPQAGGHYKPPKESQQAAQWGNEQDGQWGDDGGEWDQRQYGDRGSTEANRWSHSSVQEEDGNMNGGFDRSGSTWDDGPQGTTSAQASAVDQGWGDSGSGAAGGGVVGGWGDQNIQSQKAAGGSNTPAARVKSPHPPTSSPAPPVPAPPPADASVAVIPHPSVITSTRAVFPPTKSNNTGGKDDDWGTQLADSTDVWQQNGATQTWSGPPATNWDPNKHQMKGGAPHHGVPGAPMNHTQGAWMLWRKESDRYKVLAHTDPRAPPAPVFPLTSVPSAGGGHGAGGPWGGQHEMTPGQRAQALNNLLTDPTRQGHGRNAAAWGVPMMNGQKQPGGHQRGRSVYEQQHGGGGGGGGGAWGATANWSGDPSSSKHQKRHSGGQHRAQTMQPAGSWETWDSGGGGGGDAWGNDYSGGGRNGGGGGRGKDGWTTNGNDDGGWGAAPSKGGGGGWDDIQEEEEGYDDEDDGWQDGEYEDDDYYDDGWEDTKHKKHHDDYDAWGTSAHHKDKGKGKQTPKATPQAYHGSLHGHTPAMPGQALPYDPKLSKTMNLAYGRHDAMAAAAAAAEAAASLPPTPAAPTLPTVIPPAHDRRIIDANGASIQPAAKALYSRRRPPKERIHWVFNPDKDERVSALLQWIGAMSTELAVFGLHKFMQEGQRGALFTNADLRVGGGQPAFDWVTIDRLQLTLDRISQESVIAYNPMLHVVVFVFLLSHSGNSMAIWRRKVPIPEHIRSARKQDIQLVIDQLDPKYRVLVDELQPEPPKKKRGFWRKLFGLR